MKKVSVNTHCESHCFLSSRRQLSIQTNFAPYLWRHQWLIHKYQMVFNSNANDSVCEFKVFLPYPKEISFARGVLQLLQGIQLTLKKSCSENSCIIRKSNETEVPRSLDWETSGTDTPPLSPACLMITEAVILLMLSCLPAEHNRLRADEHRAVDAYLQRLFFDNDFDSWFFASWS